MNDKTTEDMSGDNPAAPETGELSNENSTMTWVVRPDPDLEDLIPSFVGNRRNDLVEIREAIARNDFEFVRRTAHTLKGICRPYGFAHLEMLAKDLEVAGQNEDVSRLTAIANEMQTYLDNVRIVYDN